jgi:hypothetical protein
VKSILLKRWKALNDDEKSVWWKWEVWDAKRYEHQLKVYEKNRRKKAKYIYIASNAASTETIKSSSSPSNYNSKTVSSNTTSNETIKSSSSPSNDNSASNNNLVIHEHHDRQWNEMFDKLVEYKRVHGDTNVPQRYKEVAKLGPWVNQQRQKRKRGKVPDYRIQKLDSIQFLWEPVKSGARYDPIWNSHYDKLQKYHESNGHCRVTRSDDKELNGWVIEQRMQFSRGTLKDDRKEKLDSLGFQWEVFDEVFASHLDKLKQYKQKHGDCLVPATDEELGSWVVRLRSLHEKGKLPNDRKKKLDKLGFVWRVGLTKEGAELQWHEKYTNLKEYKREHGHCLVPNVYEEDPQ